MKKRDLIKQLARELVKTRTKKGFNQDYAEEYGVSLKYYQKLESQKIMKNPSLWILHCLAKLFKATIEISPKGVRIKPR